MRFEIIDVQSIEPKMHKMDISLSMNHQQMCDAIAVLCEEMGDYAFIDAVNGILGQDFVLSKINKGESC